MTPFTRTTRPRRPDRPSEAAIHVPADIRVGQVWANTHVLRRGYHAKINAVHPDGRVEMLPCNADGTPVRRRFTWATVDALCREASYRLVRHADGSQPETAPDARRLAVALISIAEQLRRGEVVLTPDVDAEGAYLPIHGNTEWSVRISHRT